MNANKVPKYFSVIVWKSITKKLTTKPETIMSFFPNENEETLIERIYEETYNSGSVFETLKDIRRKRTQTKKRWVKAALNDYKKPSAKKPKELRQDYDYLRDYMESIGETQFKKMFGKDSPEEIIEEKIVEIERWSTDTDSYLSNYAFLPSKTKNQKMKAYETDISEIMGSIIATDYDGQIQNMIVEKPYLYVDNPIFTDRRGTLPLSDEVIEEGVSSYVYNDFAPTKDYKLRILIPKEYAEAKQVRYLDETDEKIFSEVMKQRNSSFAVHRKVFVNIGKIVSNIFKSDSINNYNLVESRLYKMFNVRFNAFFKGGSVGFGIFDYVEVNKENGWSAEIVLNEQIYQNYLNKQTIRMYEDKMKNFELSLSRSLIMVLQKDRFSCYSQKQSYEQVYNYFFFTHKFQFRTRNKKEIISRIEEALEEIKRHKVTVEDFHRDGDKFTIQFIPVTDYEMEDLIQSPTPNEHMLGYNPDLLQLN